MIGQYIRSAHHLKMVMGEAKNKFIIFSTGSSILFGAVNNDDCLTFFNNNGYGKNENHEIIIGEKIYRFGYLTNLIDFSSKLVQSINFVIVLPDNFNEEFTNFCSQNKKLFTPIFAKYTYEEDPILRYFYCLCDNSPNLFLWSICNVYKNKVSIELLSNIIKWSFSYGNLVNKLSKKTITAYNGVENILLLDSECIELRKNKRIKDVINSFNTAQKKLLREVDLTDTDKICFSQFYKLSDAKKVNFIQKMSTITSSEEIINQMKHLTSVSFEWNMASVIDFISANDNIDAEIISSDKDVLLIKVNNFESVKRLAKTTNWCISKNKSYWNNYVDNSNISQFMLFDFSKNEDDDFSIIGFTVNNDISNIVHAHNFINKDIMPRRSERRDCDDMLCPWFKTVVEKHLDVFTILDTFGINLDRFISKVKNDYEWNKKSFIDYLTYCIGDSYTVLVDSDEKFVFTTNNKDTRFLFGKCFEQIYDFTSFTTLYAFVDFSKDECDKNRIRFGFTSYDRATKQEFVRNIFDANCCISRQSFENLLSEFGLPFDTISRIDTLVNQIKCAIRCSDIETVFRLFSDAKAQKEMNAAKYDFDFKNQLFSFITNTIYSRKSVKFVQHLYKNNFSILKMCGEQSTCDLLLDIFKNINSLAFSHEEIMQTQQFTNCVNNGEDFDNTNESVANLCAYSYLFNEIYNHEFKSNKKKMVRFFNGFINVMDDIDFQVNLANKHVADILSNLINDEKNIKLAINIFATLSNCGYRGMLNTRVLNYYLSLINNTNVMNELKTFMLGHKEYNDFLQGTQRGKIKTRRKSVCVG